MSRCEADALSSSVIPALSGDPSSEESIARQRGRLDGGEAAWTPAQGGGDERKLIVRRATAADLRAYYGGDPPATVKAFAAVLDGKVMGVMGIAYGGLAKSRPAPEVFSESKPEFARHRKSFAVLRAVKELMAMIARTKPAPIAIADRNYPQSRQLLQRLGAVRIGQCEQGEVYQWGN